MVEQIAIIGIIFLASFTQSLSGFGMALVAVSLLPGLLDIRTAVPLVVLLAFTAEIILLLIYRQKLNLRAVLPVMAAALLTMPLGMWAFRTVDEHLFLSMLGLVLIAYALYALLRVNLPELRHPAWAYVSGIVAGVLSGAYAVPGPAIVIYGNCRRWQPAEFKANLQGFFLVLSITLIISHAISRNLTTTVWNQYAYALIPLGLGIVAGTSLDRVINVRAFHRLVLWMLVLMGIRLIVTNL